MNEDFEKSGSEPGMEAESESDKVWEGIMNQARLLPDVILPSALLEERTVRELRRRGLLKRKRSISSTWLAGSVAASVALFAIGVIVGQYLGTRSAVSVVAEMRSMNDAGAAAAHVQQTGTAYVEALAALVHAARQSQPGGPEAAQAREVALTALHEAANEVVRLAPNDPVAAKILQGIEQEKEQRQNGGSRPDADRQIVWF
jgi:hypothetical protein